MSCPKERIRHTFQFSFWDSTKLKWTSTNFLCFQFSSLKWSRNVSRKHFLAKKRFKSTHFCTTFAWRNVSEQANYENCPETFLNFFVGKKWFRHFSIKKKFTTFVNKNIMLFVCVVKGKEVFNNVNKSW